MKLNAMESKTNVMTVWFGINVRVLMIVGTHAVSFSNPNVHYALIPDFRYRETMGQYRWPRYLQSRINARGAAVFFMID